MGNRSNIFLNPLKSAVINAYNHYNLFLSLAVYVFKIYLNTFLILYTLSLSLSLQSNCFQFASFSKPFHFLLKFFCVNMASSSNPTSSTQRTESTEQYEEPFRTLLTPINNLEVLSELIVDFNSLQENGFNLSEEVKAQGWNRYFDRLLGLTFPILVKEF